MDIDQTSPFPTFYPENLKINHTTCIFCMATDGSNIYVSGPNGVIRVWKEGEENSKASLQGHKDLVTSMTVLKDGSLISSSDDGSLIHWNTKAYIGQAKYSGPEKSISCCVVVYNRSLASRLHTDTDHVFIGGSWDSNLYFWNPRQVTPIKILSGHDHPVKALVPFESEAGMRLASGASNGEILIWDLSQLRVINKMSAHTDAIYSLSFDNNMLISSSRDNKIKFWDQGLELTREFMSEDGFARKFHVFRKNFMVVLSGVKTIEIWDLRLQRVVEKRESKDIISEVTVMDDNKILVARRNEVNALKYVNKKMTTIKAIHKFRMQVRYPPMVVKSVFDALFGSNE